MQPNNVYHFLTNNLGIVRFGQSQELYRKDGSGAVLKWIKQHLQLRLSMEQQVTQYTANMIAYVLTCYLLMLKTPQYKRKSLHLFSDNRSKSIEKESFVTF